jgi:hypothetical protein
MKKLTCLLSLSILMLTPCTITLADEHGGVHIHLRTGEEIEDNPCAVPSYCMELKPWYHHQHYDEYEDIETQADRLHDDTSWPSEREEFSDQLLR